MKRRRWAEVCSLWIGQLGMARSLLRENTACEVERHLLFHFQSWLDSYMLGRMSCARAILQQGPSRDQVEVLCASYCPLAGGSASLRVINGCRVGRNCLGHRAARKFNLGFAALEGDAVQELTAPNSPLPVFCCPCAMIIWRRVAIDNLFNSSYVSESGSRTSSLLVSAL